MRVKELKAALADVEDSMVVMLRVEKEDGEQYMCSPSNAIPDAGCTDTDVFMIDGIDGECEHGIQSSECKEKHGD